MSEKKRLSSKLTSKQETGLNKEISAALEDIDLKKWQEACKSFAPFNYKKTTRKQWFEKHKEKVSIGKKITSFVDAWAKKLREDKRFESTSMSAIREGIIDVIRAKQKSQGIDVNRLNGVKLATFRTLVSWSQNPERLVEGPYEGRTELPEDKRKRTRLSKRGRKAKKGKVKPPEIDLVKSVEMVSSSKIKVTVGLLNDFLYPYQNVEVALKLGGGAKVSKTTPFKWNSKEQRIIVGYLPANLDVEPYESTVTVHLDVKDKKAVPIKATIHYDDCNKGIRTSTDPIEGKIKF